MTLSDISRRLNFQHKNTRQRNVKYVKKLPRLILMTDAERLPDPHSIAASLPSGSAIIFRHYNVPNRETLARSLAALCKQKHILFLIAGDARLAHKVNADGLHLSESQLIHSTRTWRCWRKTSWIITAASHSQSSIWHVKRSDADAALLSPVFKTESHPKAQPIGPLLFHLWCQKSPLPIFALGGINAANAARLVGGTCSGVAAINGFLNPY